MKPAQSILVTGGAGYIGSHAVVELLVAGHDVFVVDNLSNSKLSVIERIARIAGRSPQFERVDIRDRSQLRAVFARCRFDAVMHFAGLKAVGESVAQPLKYYDNNVAGSMVLLECMLEAGVRNMVFSSSATVYGEPPSVQFREDFPLCPVNPYGRTKMMVEDVLRDLVRTDAGWRVALLRYFNPVGAHSSGMIGEDPNGIPNNLMPYIAQVASGRLKELQIYGNDYSTPDGTGVRDYIHVVDLARGHLRALEKLGDTEAILTLNLGAGRGHSVLEMVHAFAVASGKNIPYRVGPRRPGDLAEYFADPALALKTLGWRTELGVEAMCADTWRWQQWAERNLT